MPTEADLLPLPEHLYGYRDRMRIAGYDLVHYTEAHARREALPIRHPIGDYRYAFHEVHYIEPETGQIILNPNPSYSSEERIPDWARHFESTAPPLSAGGALAEFFKDPANVLLTAIVPPFGLTLLGAGLLGNRGKRLEQERRMQMLAALKPMPKFLGY